MTAVEDYRPNVGVHLILIQDGKVLLLQRANTGFADGDWSVPGGGSTTMSPSHTAPPAKPSRNSTSTSIPAS
jgi:hypothetical protein